jgi:hypothetical protein
MLQKRFDIEQSLADNSGVNNVFAEFEKEVAEKSHAVITVTFDYLYNLITDENSLYAAYAPMVTTELRLPAKPDDSAKRKNVESWLFCDYEAKIRYAALSLDGKGPTSYGKNGEPLCAMKLANFAIRNRATVLEENSYHFVDKHKIGKPSDVPPGHMALWEDRGKLAATKLSGKLSPNMTTKDFPDLLLFSQEDRTTDDFLEVIIYDGFDNKAIESARQLTNANPAHLIRLEEKLSEVGKAWHPL